MKSKSKLKFLSLFLAVSMVVSWLPMYVTAETAEAENSATELQVFTGTDFSDPAKDKVELNVSDGNYGDYTLTDVVTGTQKSAIKVDKTVSPDGLSVNEGYWPAGNRVTAFSFDYKNDGWSQVFFAYDKSGKNGLGFVIGDGGYKNGLFIRAYKLESGSLAAAGNNDAKFICDKRYPGQHQVNCHYQEPLHIDGTVEYISDTKAKLTLKITATTADLNEAGTTLTANGGKVTVTGSWTYDLSTTQYTTFKNFGDAEYGLWFKSSKSSYLADLKVDSYASKAQEFKGKHAEILSKTAEDLTEENVDAYIAAAGDFAALDSKTQGFLKAEKALLDEMDAKISTGDLIPNFTHDDFSKPYYSSKWWAGNPAVSNDGEYNYITLNSYTSENQICLNQQYWDNTQRPYFMTIRYKGANCGFLPIYDPVTNNGCVIWVQNTTSGPNVVMKGLKDGAEIWSGSWSSFALVGPYCTNSDADIRTAGYSSSAWNTLNISFDYSSIDSGKMKLTVSGIFKRSSDGVYVDIPSVTWTYTLGTDATCLQTYKFGAYSGNPKISYFAVYTQAGTTQKFIDDYQEILSKDYDAVTPKDAAAIDEALNAYNLLPKDNYYSDEALPYKFKLENMKAYLAGDFEYDPADIDSVTAMYSKLKSFGEGRRALLEDLENELVSILENYAANQPETAREKTRVVFVGHSMVAGMNASTTYPAELRKLLEADGTADQYELFNIAVSGSETTTWYGEKFGLYLRSLQPDVIVCTIGGNDNAATFRDNFVKMIQSFQSIESNPTILLTTDMHWTGRNVDSQIKDQREVAKEYGLKIIDLKTFTQAEFEKDYNAFIAEGKTEEEALEATKVLWFQNSKGMDGIHYNAYGYEKVANYIYKYFILNYTEFSMPFSGFKNVEFYDEADVVDAESVNTAEDFANLTYSQRKYFKNKCKDKYNTIFYAGTNAEEAAAAFAGAHGTDAITDMAGYAAAMESYKALDNAVKAYLAAWKTAMDAKYAALTDSLTDEYFNNGISEEITQYNYQAVTKAYAKINALPVNEKSEKSSVRAQLYTALQTYNGKTQSKKIRIACVGDSLTHGSLSGYFMNPTPYPFALSSILGTDYIVLNSGHNGATATSRHQNAYVAYSEYQRSLDFMPDVVILMLGTNDINVAGKGNNPSDFDIGGYLYNDFLDLINDYRSLESAPTVILANVPYAPFHETYQDGKNPEKIVKLNAMLQELAKNEGLTYVDVYSLTKDWPAYDENAEQNFRTSDNLHYSNLGYQKIAELFDGYIRQGIAGEVQSGYINSFDYTQAAFDSLYSGLTAPEAALTPENLADISNARVLASTAIVTSVKDALAAKMKTVDSNMASYSPSVEGGTIKTVPDPDSQDLKFVISAPVNSTYDGWRIKEYGAIFLPKNILGDGELTKDFARAAVASKQLADGDSMPETFYANLGKSAQTDARCARDIAIRVYVVWTDGVNDYIVYSCNSDAEKNIESGTAVRSVYGIARAMATAIFGTNEYGKVEYRADTVPSDCTDLSTIENKNILKFVVDNLNVIKTYVEQNRGGNLK